MKGFGFQILLAAGTLCALAFGGCSKDDGATNPTTEQLSEQIVFESYRGGNYDIFKMNPDGTVQTQVTSSQGEDREPVWSPDGKKIAFSSDRFGHRNIFVMNEDGSDQAQITTGDYDSDPGWSPDGTKLLFTRWKWTASQWGGYNEDPNLYLVDADGKNPTQLTTTNQDAYGVWTPDGKIVFVSRRTGISKIYVMSAQGLNPVALAQSDSVDDYDPTLSKDGKKIYFVSNLGRDTTYYLCGMNVDGSSRRNIYESRGRSMNDPTVSRDGSKIMFSQYYVYTGTRKLFSVQADGMLLVEITEGGHPSWR